MTRDEWLTLAKRCEKATGPDREIDVAIIRAAYPDIGECAPLCEGDEPVFWHAPYCKQPCPTLTASLDAITGLIETRLPGFAWKCGTCSVSDDAWICPDWNGPEHGKRLIEEFGGPARGTWLDEGIDIDRRPPGNIALALCEAFCRAMAERADK